MTAFSPRSGRWLARAGLAAAALLAGLALLVLAAHTPPARRLVLRQAIALLESRAGVVLSADGLSYNLLQARISLSNARLAAVRDRGTPFLSADRIEISLPPSAVFRPLTIDRIHVENGRLFVLRRADGTTNLPQGGDDAEPSEPSPLPIGHVDIPGLSLTVVDESQDLSLLVPALTIDIRDDAGSVRLDRPGRVQRGDVRTEITRLGGGLAFDGEALTLSRFGVATSEADVAVDGTAALLVTEPRADLRFTAAGDVAGLARWGALEPAPAGRFIVEGAVDGPLSSPTARASVRSDALAYEGLTASRLRIAVEADPARLGVTRLETAFAGGRIEATGDYVLASSLVTLRASWSDLDLEALVRAHPATRDMRPAGRASGTAAIRGPASSLAALTIDARNRIDALASAPTRMPVAGRASLHVADGAWRLELDQDVDGAVARAALAGTLDAERLASSSLNGTVAVQSSDLARLMQTLRAGNVLHGPNAPIDSGRISVEARLSGSFAAPRFQIDARARGLANRGVSDVSADLDAAGTFERAAVQARLRQGTANAIDAEGTVWLEAARFDGQVRGTLNEPGGLAPDVPIDGRIDLRFEGAGPFTAPRGRGRVALVDARYDDVDLGTVSSSIVLEEDAARVEFTAGAFGATGRADIGLMGGRSAGLDVRVDGLELQRLARIAKLEQPLSGRVSLAARGKAPLDDWRRGAAAVDITELDARANDVPIGLRRPARATFERGTLDVAGFEAAVGGTVLSAAGRYPVLDDAPPVASRDALRAVLVGDVSHALEAAEAAGAQDAKTFKGNGPITLVARVTGAGDAPVVSADLEVGPATLEAPDLPPVQDLQFRVHVADGWAELIAASAGWQGARVDAEGRLPLVLLRDYLPETIVSAVPAVAGSASLTARATSITPTVLEPFLDAATLAQLEGAVDASVQVDAAALDIASLRGEARFDRLEFRAAGLPVTQREATRIRIEHGVARVAAWNWTGQGATLAVDGQVGLVDRTANLTADGRFDLRLLTPFVREADIGLSGTLAPRISVSGALDDPTIDGTLTLAGAEVRLREPALVASELDAAISLSPTRADITSLSGQLNGGALSGGGEVTYGGSDPVSARITVGVAGMGLDFPEGLRSELNLDLALAVAEAPEGPGGRVTGTVTVLRSDYREPLAVVTQVLSTLRTERLAAAASPEAGLADRLDLNVRVVTTGDITVDNNLARLQLGADLRVIGTAAAPALSGRAILQEGGELFFGRNRYTIESGTVDFANPDTIEPDLNIRARTRAGGEEIELSLAGTPDDLDVELRSLTTPELGQADVTSLLLTGRRLDDVSGAEAQIVGEQVLGYLSGDVLGAASRVVGLDTIRLGGVEQTTRRDPVAVASEADPTSRLTFGKTLGNLLEITFSQSLRDGDAQTWILDYNPIRQIDLRLVSGDENLRSYEFRHDVSLGSPAGPRREASASRRSEARVSAVTFAGTLGVPEARLREALDLEPGDRFEFTDWQRDRDRLESLLHGGGYLEARVSPRRQEDAGSVALTYEIDAGPLTTLTVGGYSLPRAARRDIETAWTRSVFDDFLKEEVETIVRRVLAENGYLEPRVAVSLAANGSKALTIAIDPGQKIAERRITIDAGDEALSRELERRVDELDAEEAAWRNPETLETLLTGELRTRGHVRARVTAAAPRVDGRTAVLPVTVEPGPLVRVRDVRVEGASNLDAARLIEAAAVEAGAPYDPASVDEARERIVREYRREGFTDARATVQAAAPDDGGPVSVVFRVEEGPRQVLREIAVRGNRAIDTDVVTRAVDLDLGAPLGADAWLRARARLFDTALFRRVDVTPEPMEDPREDDGERPMRLTVTVEEWPALRVRYGFQLSEERPASDVEGRDLTPGISADVTRRTLFGRAITVGAAAEYQRRERLARGFLNAPLLFGWPIESLMIVERARRDFADATLVTDRSRVSWEQRVRVSTGLRLSYSYSFERNHTFDTAGRRDPFDPLFDVTINVARLSGAAVYDTRDDPIDTGRGWLVSSNFEYAPESLGSAISFVRYLQQAYYFKPLGPVVLASAARAGLAKALAGQTLIFSERFFSGGARSVRGVAEDGLGPRDVFDEAAGGRALLVLNQEVRFPLYRWFRGVGFIDAGNVFERPGDVDLSDIVGAVGAGLRITTPFALLRADVARLWSPRPGQKATRWMFGIGHAF